MGLLLIRAQISKYFLGALPPNHFTYSSCLNSTAIRLLLITLKIKKNISGLGGAARVAKNSYKGGPGGRGQNEDI